MKRKLARMIQAAVAVFGVWVIGAGVRGPFAEDSVPRDLAAGAAVVGAAGAIAWSEHELGRGRS